MRVLVTGATGYIGGRLIPRLLDRGHEVRVLVREPARISARPWEQEVEICEGDLLRPETLPPALEGVDAAYYLVHSMYAGSEYESLDREAAENFVRAAKGIGKVIYLGGILPKKGPVSSHLRSRAEVGEILRRELPTTEFRAGPIIGSGSASFEMVRYLSERLPIVLGPKWMHNEVQTIFIRDIMRYLIAALDHDALGVVDVGSDPLSFKRMLDVYAEIRGHRRVVIPLPLFPPRLAALWVGLVTPIPNRLAMPLIEGIVTPILADTRRAREVFPNIQPMTYWEAVKIALWRIQRGEVETRWSSSLGGATTYELMDWEGMIREVRTIHVDSAPERIFSVFSSLGGERGWLAWDWAWQIRGWIDKLVGGPGLRRGRRDPRELLPGEAVDFWRVESICFFTLLRLRAEMRVPGRAWIQWEVMPEEVGSRLVQTAIFAPKGVGGVLYWWVLYPIHTVIFRDLVRLIAKEAGPGDD